ncbi:MAG: MarR family transcriptional regulator [Asticcacaulis sp.]
MNALRRIVQALRASASRSEVQTGLTAAQMLVMKQIHEQRAVSINELAVLTFTHQSTVSEVVSRLEARHLLTRDRSAEDGRRVEVRLTGKGAALVTQSLPSAHDRLMAAVKSLPPETLDALADGLTQLVAAADLTDQKPDMFFEKTPAN